MFKKIIIIFIVAGIILAPYFFGSIKFKQIIQADTNVNDYSINTDTTWNLAGSPYIVTAPGGSGRDVYVWPEATLIIEAGVVIKLADDTGFRVDGSLIVNGEAGNPVIFTSLRDDENGGDSTPDDSRSPAPGDWRAIYINDGGELIMDNAIVQYGGFKRYYLEKAPAGIITVRQAWAEEDLGQNTGAISCQEDVTVKIKNSTILSNKIGLEINISGGGEEEELNIAANNSTIAGNEEAGIINNSENGIDAVNNWWGHSTGPYHEELNSSGQGDTIIGEVVFSPWLNEKPGEEIKPNPVIIVPGIMASYLNRNEPGEPEVWPNLAKMTLPGDDSYLNELKPLSSGYPSQNNLLATDIFRQIATKDFYQGLIDKLGENGYHEGINLFVFPYDWRLDIDWLAGDPPETLANLANLKDKIKEVKNKTGAEKVDIIAHSMGGLIVKRYLQIFASSSVDQFIDIATPHLGAPKAFKILMYGDDMGFNILGFRILDPTRVKYISQNMSAVYALLPSLAYFGLPGPDYYAYIADIDDQDNNNIRGNLTYDQSREFMVNSGRNTYLLDSAQDFHNRLDGYFPQSHSVKTYNIVACGQPTIGKVYVLNKEKNGQYEYGLKYISGDGTVPVASAEALKPPLAYVHNVEHAYLPSAGGVKELVGAILENKENYFDFSSFSDLTVAKDNCRLNGLQVSLHSPINLHIYNEGDNHLGPAENGDLENQIPGAQYDIIGGNQFAFLPAGSDYLIVGQATASGTFNARLSVVVDSQYVKTVYFRQVPLLTNRASVVFTPDEEEEGNFVLTIDQDGDGREDQEIEPASILNGEENEDIAKPATVIIVGGRRDSQGNYIATATITLAGQDNQGGSGFLAAEYSLNSGPVQTYAQPLVLSQAGVYTIAYRSVDRAGNEEAFQNMTLTIVNQPTTKTISQIIEDIENYYRQGLIKRQGVKKSLVRRLKAIDRQIKKCQNINKPKRKRLCRQIAAWRLKAVIWTLNINYYRHFILDPAYLLLKNNVNNLIDNL